MVQGISSPFGSQFTAAQKPSTQAQPFTVPDAAPVPEPVQAPGGGRPVRAAQASDGEKKLVDERAAEQQAERPAEESARTQLSIGLDKATNTFVYRGVDGQTHEVRKQWPTEQALRRIAKLRELSGKIVDEIL